jgi:hypothetical protein
MPTTLKTQKLDRTTSSSTPPCFVGNSDRIVLADAVSADRRTSGCLVLAGLRRGQAHLRCRHEDGQARIEGGLIDGEGVVLALV